VSSSKTAYLLAETGYTSNGRIFKTTTAGGTGDCSAWVNITGNLDSVLRTDVPVVDLAEDPLNTSTLYLATGAGVYKTIDGGKNWAAWNLNLPGGGSIFATGIRLDDKRGSGGTLKVFVGTWGGGIWSRDGGEGFTYTYLEGESGAGAGTAPMSIGNDGNASGGQFTWSATSSSNASVPANGHVTYSFTVGDAGTHNLWGRFLVGPMTTSDDSLWVRMDLGAWVQWNNLYQRIGNSAYGWDQVHDTANGDALINYNLSAGAHTLEIAYRESGLKIDRFLVTNDLGFSP
jgi:hypothetical protein